MQIENIAEICHEANRIYCTTLGDFSQTTWDDAPKWQRDSAINGVLFHKNNPGATDAASHENWLRQKADEGWKFGPVKDPSKKQHPCFVAFDLLPPEQQMKDRLFRHIVKALLGV